MKFLNMTKNFFVLSWKRLWSETPRYWRRVSLISFMLSGATTFLTENDAIIPAKYKYITGYVAAASGFASFLVHFNTNNQNLIRKSNDALLEENANKKIDNI